MVLEEECIPFHGFLQSPSKVCSGHRVTSSVQRNPTSAGSNLRTTSLQQIKAHRSHSLQHAAVWILSKQFDLNHLQINPKNPNLHGLEEEILQKKSGAHEIGVSSWPCLSSSSVSF
jgi:hypothetical protein